MHLGYVLKKFPRVSETFVLNEVLELQRQGHRVTVFSLTPPNDGVFHRALADLAEPVIYLPARRGEAALQHLYDELPRLRAASGRLWGEVEDLLLARRPDLVPVLLHGLDIAAAKEARGIDHLHAHFATVAAYTARTAHAISGIPFSVTCHAKDIYRDGVSAERFQRLLRPAAFVVTVCEANRQHIRARLGGDRLDVRTLHNGVDTRLFDPRSREPDPEPLLLAIGRLVEKKGFHVLLEALARLGERGVRPRCLLVGEGEERPRLEAMVRGLGLQGIEFAGLRTQEEIRHLLTRAWVLVLPCIVGADGNRDALPTVLLEAIAAGVPIVSTPIGGIVEIADGGTAGVLVEPGDSVALADALAGLLADPARGAALARAGRAHAERCFDLRRNVARLASWFADATPVAVGSLRRGSAAEKTQ